MTWLKRILYPVLSFLARPLRGRIVAFAYSRADASGGAERALWTERAVAFRQKLYGRAPAIRLARRGTERLWVDVAEWEGGNLFFGRPYEPIETGLARSLITEGTTAIDVGANVGVYTLLASRAVGRTGRVYAFEPASKAFELLRRNVALAGATNVTLERLAVSDTPGMATLVVNRESGLTSLGATGRGETVGSETVRCVTLDEYASAHGVARISFLKVDVEGFEGHVLRGARALLERESEIAVLAELAEENFRPLGLRTADVTEWMKALGFEAWPFGANVFFARSGTPAAQGIAAVSARAAAGS